jgi:4-aminobutyrate aminotransferase-like enzyme
MSPPLIWTTRECDILVDTLGEAIGEVTSELKAEGFLK